MPNQGKSQRKCTTYFYPFVVDSSFVVFKGKCCSVGVYEHIYNSEIFSMEIVRYWVFQVQHTFQYLQGQNHAERYRNLGIAPFEAADAIEDAISSTSCWLGYGLASLDLVFFM